MPGVRAAQRERTRLALLDRAEELFARDGYGAVGLPAVVAAAGVTKGALYHQFDGKAALFSAVLDRVQERVADRVVAAAAAHPDDPWEQLLAGCRAFLAAGTDPATARIVLVDGPAVLGIAAWRERDERTSGRHLADALAALVAAGEIPDQPVAPLARLLSGAMNEAATWLAGPGRAEDPDGAVSWAALRGLLDGLRAGPASSRRTRPRRAGSP